MFFSIITLAIAIYGINSKTVSLMDSADAMDAAAQVMDAVCAGDFDALEELLSDQPDLGECPPKNQEAENLIWHAYIDSIQYQLYPSEEEMAVDVSVSCLDVPAVLTQMQSIVPQLLKDAKRNGDADIYDAEHNYQEAFLSETLSTAAKQILSGETQTREVDVTLKLVRSRGSWRVLPTEELQNLLSGFISE